jgi:LPS export ABC transporter permease LptG
MIRIFVTYFLMTLLSCVALVCLFTFFEIIDNVFENDISYSLVAEYFLFLQPHLLMLLVPISVLIATLVTFGSLEKTNQIVAFKSVGVSVYRIAVPVLLVASIVCAFLFLIEEYVLPFANQRQDSLRQIIKGGPVQTYLPGDRWIFGGDNRLYRYRHYNSKLNLFGELSVFVLELGGDGLISHVHARRAAWDRRGQTWILTGGWERDFVNESFEPFEEKSFSFAESPDYFTAEVRESSKMTFLELEKHISVLQQGGFEVDYLKTELYKKVSFPFVNLIMAVIGVPFALTMGRRGTMYGIGAGILIGIVYWGAFGVFDVLGANGLLAPELAAWGPNILFGAGGFMLLSVVKT